MKILSSNGNGMQGFHGKIGTPTAMFDYYGNRLYVGDVVATVTYGVNGALSYEYGIHWVCEEDPEIASFTGEKQQFVMGIASVYSSSRFNEVFGDHFYKINKLNAYHSEEFYAGLEKIVQHEWSVFRVKSFCDVVNGEKIDGLCVEEVENDD